MKALYILFLSMFVFSGAAFPVAAQNPQPAKLEVLTLKTVPEGKYTVTLELKQLDGVPVQVTLESRHGSIEGTDERLGKIQGRIQLIGNGVFMVQLRGNGYLATQFWVFRADGSAEIKEIPERGEKQTAVPQ